MENLIVIGSGPAGQTAAIYAGQANLKPLMFEGLMAGGIAAGGQLTTTTDIHNFPGFPDGVSGLELMFKMREQTLKSGVKILTETVEKVELDVNPFRVVSSSGTYETKTLIIANGAIAQRLGAKGEDQYWQKGVSACAVCDGGLPIFRNQHLVVIGGGDTAIEEALYLTKFARKVTMLVRRNVFRASKTMQAKAFHNAQIEIMWHTELAGILGDGKKITHLKIRNNQTNKLETIDVAGLFYALGHKPNTEMFKGQLEMDETGYLVTKPNSTMTNIPGVFAAGDVQDHVYRQAIVAAGSGCMAALEAERYLQI
ncbi:thioredoxin-disulfide reductase [bacterium]|nr:thioredoxin-disulfide reductase [bacterium]MBT3581880.1 thioredoxin-disulfide reductase [bacterium]MBT4552297.1 thioredoxin-disulfide reductase [bacterium]